MTTVNRPNFRLSNFVIYSGLILLFLLINKNAYAQCTYLLNTDFENTQIPAASFSIVNQSAGAVAPWKTTAADGAQEVWSSGFLGVPAYSGNQFIELNANVAAVTYQDFTAPGGAQLTLNFAHRGRSGTDVMNVTIGSPSPASLGNGTAVSGTTYLNLGNFSDGNTAWGYYSITFTLPVGVANNAFSVRFASVSAAGGDPAYGNFLDAISITDVAPALTGTPSVTLTCPAATTDLSSLTATNQPSGAIQTWHTGPVAADANRLSSTVVNAPGTYYTSFYNPAKGCYGPTVPVIVTGPTNVPEAPTVVLTQPTCLSPVGTITITTPLGADLTYSLDNINYTASTTFAGLAPGTYSVWVSNCTIGTLCVSPPTTVVINPPIKPLAPTVHVTTQPSCTLATGTITVSASTDLDLIYSIDGATYNNTSGVFNGVMPGTYQVTALSKGGCLSPPTSITVMAQPPAPPAPTVSVTTQPSCTLATGTITVSAPIKTGYRYSINGTDYTNTTGVFTGLPAKVYVVTVRDSSGCTSAASSVTVIAQPSTPTYLSIPGSIPASCLGATATSTARIDFVALLNTERADISLGSSYTGPAYGAASNQTVSGGAVSFTGLPNPANPQNYTIRLYGSSGTCFTDVTVLVNPADCHCPAALCIPVAMHKMN
ncbi:hypothetical protein [Spirosoma radiotolerans]|uniref:hypothetical protein n=1 Tax=Spirosoma radiotolerans TaxID=1379870 RepID=UPI00069831A9|nr:hypothetical protein [Spirosoma radiotolerans]